MENLTISQVMAIVLGSIAIFRVGYEVIVGVSKPNIKQDLDLVGMKKDIGSLEESVNLIKTNHLAHLERDMKEAGQAIVRIETILDERLPQKK